MLTCNFKTALVLTIAFIISLGNLKAQEQPLRAMERLQSLKKVKLLEILELNEADADKFIVKYNEYEKNVFDKYKKFENVCDDLHKAIDNNDYKNIEKLNDNYIVANKELNQAVQDKFENVKKILPKEKFAKYLVFERRFQNEFRKQVFKRFGDKDGEVPNTGRNLRNRNR